MITARARIQFFYLLSERSFRGKLIASHKQKNLALIVCCLIPKNLVNANDSELYFRLSRTKREAIAMEERRTAFQAARSLSPLSASSSRCGRPWGRQFDALMNCESTASQVKTCTDWPKRRLHGQCQQRD